MAEEDYGTELIDAGDPCGRCGCARRDHVPGCSSHGKCKQFSAPKAPKKKKR